MRGLAFIPFAVLAGVLIGCTTGTASAGQTGKHRAQCADFGFNEGTDAFANCMMQLTLRNQSKRPPDHEALVRRYGELSMARRGDDRYPVCGASMMDNELDTTLNKWVGPDCQMAPD